RNLLSNAAKFTRRGSIDVRAGRIGDGLVITVRDTGIGIATAQLESLFEPFRQGDGSTTREHGGLGIGLALSRQYARLMGGDLSVASALGDGSTFTLTIPCVSGITTLDAPSTDEAVRPTSRSAAGPATTHATDGGWAAAIPSPVAVLEWARDVIQR